jgi:hypothetical protein
MDSASHTGVIRLSAHALARLTQRGLKFEDLELFTKFGEEVDDGYVISHKAIEHYRGVLKAQMQRLEKLRGAALIESSGQVITLYRADKTRLRRLREGSVRKTHDRP